MGRLERFVTVFIEIQDRVEVGTGDVIHVQDRVSAGDGAFAFISQDFAIGTEQVIEVGAFAGWTCGTLFTGLSLAWQRHQLVHHPERVFTALVQGFLFKLVVLGSGAAALRWLAPLAELADWRGFLVGYALAVALLGASGTAEILRMVRVGPKEQRAS